jgi:hypothetical protein
MVAVLLFVVLILLLLLLLLSKLLLPLTSLRSSFLRFWRNRRGSSGPCN